MFFADNNNTGFSWLEYKTILEINPSFYQF